MIDFLDRALRVLERAMEWLIAGLVLLLVLIVASQFVDRHFVTLPVAAPDAYARVILVWLTFTGFAVAVKNGLNIRVDLIDSRLPERVRAVSAYIFDALMILIVSVVGIHGWRLIEIGGDQERLGTVLSEAWPAAALFFSCIAMVLFLILRIILRATGRLPLSGEPHLPD